MSYTPHVGPVALDMAASCFAMQHEYRVGKYMVFFKGHSGLPMVVCFGVYSSEHHIHHTTRPDTHTYLPPPPPPGIIGHPPLTPRPTLTTSPNHPPPNPRPPLHPIPDHHPSTLHDKSLTSSVNLDWEMPFLRAARACVEVVLKQ